MNETQVDFYEEYDYLMDEDDYDSSFQKIRGKIKTNIAPKRSKQDEYQQKRRAKERLRQEMIEDYYSETREENY